MMSDLKNKALFVPGESWTGFDLEGPWAGVGSRETPDEILLLMARYACTAYDKKLGPLHSGDAIGADFAFWVGAKLSTNFEELQAKIFLSRNGFQQRWVNPKWPFINSKKLPEEIYLAAQQIAYKARGGFYGLGPGGIALMTRNAFQILSETLLNPVSKMIYYAEPTGKGERVKGGTNCALQIAIEYNVPRLNLYFEENQELLKAWLANNESMIFYPDNFIEIIHSRKDRLPYKGF